MPQYDYDLITIGAGSGGVRASRLAGKYGARVAVVESSRVGGTCVMRGCVPKKLLVYGAAFSNHFNDALGFGWRVCETLHDWGKLIAAKNKELDRLEGIYNRMLRDSGVAMVAGRGVLADPHTVEVGGKRITGDKILIATGGWPVTPDFPGKENVISCVGSTRTCALPWARNWRKKASPSAAIARSGRWKRSAASIPWCSTRARK